MKFTAKERTELSQIAQSINVPELAFLAVVQVESNGIKGEMINGRLEPLIRYEGHYFDKLCDPQVQKAARAAGVSSPKAGGIKNPAKQVDRWKLVKKAAVFDKNAAYISCSYGVGQVMGSHWDKLSFATFNDFLNMARSGLAGQARIMAAFIKTFGLDDELRALDWSGFARGYNGKNYAKDKYHIKIATAYADLGGTNSISVENASFLRLGSKGAEVRELQALLSKVGFTVDVDGDFGTSTRDAVKAFQRANRLDVDGKVGPETQKALSGIRAISSQTAGEPSVTKIEAVKKGVTTAIAVPAAVEAIKQPINEVITQVSGVELFASLVTYLQTGLAVISVIGIVAGLSYAGYGWWKSKQTDKGTQAGDNPVSEDPIGSDDLIPEVV